jgi:ATP-dependent RNA helicase DDX5/DBP2
MGFEPQIRKIAENTPETRQTLLFSATWPRDVQKLAEDFVKNAVMVQVGDTNRLNANKAITQNLMLVRSFEKREKLMELLVNMNLIK